HVVLHLVRAALPPEPGAKHKRLGGLRPPTPPPRVCPPDHPYGYSIRSLDPANRLTFDNLRTFTVGVRGRLHRPRDLPFFGRSRPHSWPRPAKKRRLWRDTQRVPGPSKPPCKR